jgi:hypothetical protein
MTSKKQKAANRANAQKSTGPRSSNGKSRSAQNALQHGLTATTLVLPDEDEAAWVALRERMFHYFDPISILEEELVEDLVRVLWRLRRVPQVEAGIFQEAHHRAAIDGMKEALHRMEMDSIDDVFPPTEEVKKMRQQVADAESALPLTVSARGFWQDAQGPNMLGKLTRYETCLENRFHRLLRELERLQAQRVEGEVVE